jgi:hypothetical protein
MSVFLDNSSRRTTEEAAQVGDYRVQGLQRGWFETFPEIQHDVYA